MRGPSTILALLVALGALACARSAARWRADLDDPDPFVRGLAAVGLAFESPAQAEPALAELLAAIDRVELGLARPAARALVFAAPWHVPSLLTFLVEDEFLSAEEREALRAALAAVGAEAVEPVLACLRGAGRERFGDLGEVLLALGEPAVPALMRLLAEEPDPRLQSYAAFLLACLGPKARLALPALRSAAGAEDPDLRAMASEAIASLEGREWTVPKPGESR